MTKNCCPAAISFVVFLLLILKSQCQNELCRFESTNSALPSNWSYATIEHVRHCFQSIPLNEIVVRKTIEQLKNSLDFYSFLSLIRQSGSPYFTSVDLQNELEKISLESNWTNDYEFHMKIVETWRKLNDFHTRYHAPKAYARFYLLLPFIFEYFSSENVIRVRHQVKLYSSLTGQDLRDYTNVILTKIDGINAMDYLKNFAENQSLMSKDFLVKLNSVFRREFWLRNLDQYSLPMKTNLTLTFVNDREFSVDFPYLIFSTRKFQNREEFEEENRFSSESPRTTGDEIYLDLIEKENLLWYSEERTSTFKKIFAGKRSFYFEHSSSRTAIVRLSTFDEIYFDEVKEIFSNIKGENLILDLIGNEGGHSCMAYGLLRYLVPEYFPLNFLYEPMDARTTKPLITFSSAFQLYPQSILDLRTGQTFSDLQWIQPFVNYTRGQSTDSHSMKWSINCDGIAFGQGKFWIRNQTGNDYFSSIYVLTDGNCGSACSLFLSKLKFGSNFKRIYGIGGGYPNDEETFFESSSYAGGGAFSWDQIVQFYRIQSAGQNSSIDYLPSSAHLNVNVYELYINNITQLYPREFDKQPIDRRLSSSDYFNLQIAFEKIIRDYSKPNNAISIFHFSPLFLTSTIFLSFFYQNN